MAVVQTYLAIILIVLLILLAVGPRLGSAHKLVAIVASLVAIVELGFGVIVVLLPIMETDLLGFALVIVFQVLASLCLVGTTGQAIQKKGMTCNVEGGYAPHGFYVVYFILLFYFKSAWLLPIF